jgi:hypothetical protein
MIAMRGDDVLTCSDAGGGVKKDTTIGMGGTMVITADADLAGVAMDVAVTVTVDPMGMADGAVYMTALRSSLALKLPQMPGLPQVTDQVTRLFTDRTGGAPAKVAAAIRVAEA